MIPYIIINGVSSKSINGLLIQSLPPISKPKKRTSIEEIDGRDGDIVTTLGYQAYDKTITIGLKGDYDVDDVIEFFNQEGIITFSNELDKYYHFALYEKIDFNKLVRYKTANITIHVQPFKYSYDEPPIEWTNVKGQTIHEMRVINSGNVYSRPVLTITGKNQINVYINDKHIFKITLNGQGETVIIDAVEMNATSPEGDYLNRKVLGDYNDLNFLAGVSNLRITGTMDKITLKNYSRWI